MQLMGLCFTRAARHWSAYKIRFCAVLSNPQSNFHIVGNTAAALEALLSYHVSRDGDPACEVTLSPLLWSAPCQHVFC